MAEGDGGGARNEDYERWAVSIATVEKDLRPLRPGEKIVLSASHPVHGDMSIERSNPPQGFLQRHFPALLGLLLLLVAVGLAFAFAAPTPLQVRVILAVLALGGGAFATEIAGMIRVDLSLGEKFAVGATGALAVFVILYFAVPAQ